MTNPNQQSVKGAAAKVVEPKVEATTKPATSGGSSGTVPPTPEQKEVHPNTVLALLLDTKVAGVLASLNLPVSANFTGDELGVRVTVDIAGHVTTHGIESSDVTAEVKAVYEKMKPLIGEAILDALTARKPEAAAQAPAVIRTPLSMVAEDGVVQAIIDRSRQPGESLADWKVRLSGNLPTAVTAADTMLQGFRDFCKNVNAAAA